MTTISYKEGIIAYDGRAVGGHRIVDDNFNKKYVRDGIICFMCGEVGALDTLLDMYVSDCLFEEKLIDIEASAIIVDGDLLLHIGLSEGALYKNPLDPKKHYSIGSGSDYSLMAMDLGKTARESIVMASKRDIYTGGAIKTFKTKWTK